VKRRAADVAQLLRESRRALELFRKYASYRMVGEKMRCPWQHAHKLVQLAPSPTSCW